MRSIRITEAQAQFSELVQSLSHGDDVVITKGDQPVARLSSDSGSTSLRDIQPVSVGAVLIPFSPQDDLLEEMTDE